MYSQKHIHANYLWEDPGKVPSYGYIDITCNLSFTWLKQSQKNKLLEQFFHILVSSEIEYMYMCTQYHQVQQWAWSRTHTYIDQWTHTFHINSATCSSYMNNCLKVKYPLHFFVSYLRMFNLLHNSTIAVTMCTYLQSTVSVHWALCVQNTILLGKHKKALILGFEISHHTTLANL